MRLFRISLYALASIVAVLFVAWAFGALYFDFPKAGASVLFVTALLAILIFVRGKLLKLGAIFGACAVIALWWLTLEPSNDRAWQPDVAQTASARVQWRRGHHPQCAKLRLPHRDRFHAALGNAYGPVLADSRHGRGH